MPSMLPQLSCQKLGSDIQCDFHTIPSNYIMFELIEIMWPLFEGFVLLKVAAVLLILFILIVLLPFFLDYNDYCGILSKLKNGGKLLMENEKYFRRVIM